MARYDWPLNVRELEQSLRAAIVLAEDRVITIDDLPEAVANAVVLDPVLEDDASAKDDGLRRELLVHMADAKGNVSEVACAMGKARRQIQRWARRFGIDPEAFRER
jgi:transcriptional regulator of acetoin/glycerol metabolism